MANSPSLDRVISKLRKNKAYTSPSGALDIWHVGTSYCLAERLATKSGKAFIAISPIPPSPGVNTHYSKNHHLTAPHFSIFVQWEDIQIKGMSSVPTGTFRPPSYFLGQVRGCLPKPCALVYGSVETKPRELKNGKFISFFPVSIVSSPTPYQPPT